MADTIKIMEAALSDNNKAAEENRRFFREKNLFAINMISSPGSGKTSILERMGGHFGRKLAVITGDIQMTYDAERIEKSGAYALQIETGGSCHLSAAMVKKGLETVPLSGVTVLVIENVGNLVCPSTFDLGEDIKTAVLSVAEGDEKPAKYPPLFVRADAVIINKIDLLPYVDFNVERAVLDCRKLNNTVNIFKTSCKTGEGLDEYFNYIKALIKQ